MKLQSYAALTEHISKNFEVNKDTLLELSFTETNLYIDENL